MAYIPKPSGNYVKFIRGTSKAWENMTAVDNDTLYFIIDSDSDVGSLYLGSTLISTTTSGDISNITISNIKDISISDTIADSSVLVYNLTTEKWENASLDEVWAEASNVFEGASAEKDGTKGLVPAPKKADSNLYLKGDGTWANPMSALDEVLYGNTSADIGKTMRQIAAEEVAKVVNGASESYDTLAEIEAWILTHEDIVGDLVNIDSALDALNEAVFGVEEKTDPDSGEVITAKVPGLVEKHTILANRVDTIEERLCWNTLVEE